MRQLFNDRFERVPHQGDGSRGTVLVENRLAGFDHGAASAPLQNMEGAIGSEGHACRMDERRFGGDDFEFESLGGAIPLEAGIVLALIKVFEARGGGFGGGFRFRIRRFGAANAEVREQGEGQNRNGEQTHRGPQGSWFVDGQIGERGPSRRFDPRRDLDNLSSR